MPIGRRARQREKLLPSIVEVAGHPRTKIGQWTTGKNEGDGQRLTLEIRGAHRLAKFVCKMVLGQLVADLQWIHVTQDANQGIGGKLTRDGGGALGLVHVESTFVFPDLVD